MLGRRGGGLLEIVGEYFESSLIGLWGGYQGVLEIWLCLERIESLKQTESLVEVIFLVLVDVCGLEAADQVFEILDLPWALQLVKTSSFFILLSQMSFLWFENLRDAAILTLSHRHMQLLRHPQLSRAARKLFLSIAALIFSTIYMLPIPGVLFWAKGVENIQVSRIWSGWGMLGRCLPSRAVVLLCLSSWRSKINDDSAVAHLWLLSVDWTQYMFVNASDCVWFLVVCSFHLFLLRFFFQW